MSEELKGKRVAFLTANEGVERVELIEPWRAVGEAGAAPELIAPEPGEVKTVDHLERSTSFKADTTVSEADPEEYDALVLPGGVANPDHLRTVPEAVDFVRHFVESGKPIGVICHGPWTMIEAGGVTGHTLTSYPSLRSDIANAGGTWTDEEVVVDEGIVSSRGPQDLPAFCDKIVEEIAEGVHSRHVGAVAGRSM